MNNKSILFITTGDISSIATMKRALGMANPLTEIGWEVTIVAEDCEENRKRIKLECNENVKIRYYQKAKIKAEVREKTKISKEVKADYIYFCSFSIRNRLIKSKLSYKPEILIEHSELQSSIPDLSLLKKIAAYTLEFASIMYADRLVCASKFLTSFYKKKARIYSSKTLPVLYSPYAYNEEVMTSPRTIVDQLEKAYSGKKVFLYMGTMTRNYGLFTMIEAIKLVSEKRSDFIFIFIGKGRHLIEAKELVLNEKLSQWVEFAGYVEESQLSSFFQIADAFISPVNNTIQDIARCPSKIYMYLPFQKPVFTCPYGEPKEIFASNGYYFDNSKPITLSGLMENMFDSKKMEKVINIEKHNWNSRSIEFDNWISND